jgi:hypothetical protein
MRLAFNKIKEISLLSTLIVIISFTSSTFLPLNDGHTLPFSSLSSQPAFAQPFGQSSPFEEEREERFIPSPPPSSSPAMDFAMFMDSFANSIFNGTSTFAGVGTSIVDDIEVSGIRFDKSQNQLSVTLSHTATQIGENYSNNITGRDTATSNTGSSITNSNSVSIIATRIPISTLDILSIANSSPSSSSFSPSLDAFDNEIADSTTEDPLSSFSSDSFNPFSLLSNLQIGSTTLTDADWTEPQIVTMSLIGGGDTNQEQQTNSVNTPMADFVLVSVIPYTGVGNNTTSSAG